MSDTQPFASRHLEIDKLEDSIIRHRHRINAGTYDLLVDLREFDQVAYSKVRGLTRVANRKNEDELLAFARKHTTFQVEQRCRELHYGTNESVKDAQLSFERRSLSTCRDPSRGTMTFTVEVPIEQGELINKALDKARDASNLNDAEFAGESWSARQADAFVRLANNYLSGQCADQSAAHTSDNYTVTVHVDQNALARGEGRAGLRVSGGGYDRHHR